MFERLTLADQFQLHDIIATHRRIAAAWHKNASDRLTGTCALAATSTAYAYEYAQVTHNATNLDIADKFSIISDTARRAIETSMDKTINAELLYLLPDYASDLNNYVINNSLFYNDRQYSLGPTVFNYAYEYSSIEKIEHSYKDILVSMQRAHLDASNIPALPLTLFLRDFGTSGRAQNHFTEERSIDSIDPTHQLHQRELEFIRIEAQKKARRATDRAHYENRIKYAKKLAHIYNNGTFEMWTYDLQQHIEGLEEDIEEAQKQFQVTDDEITIIEATPDQRRNSTLEAEKHSIALLARIKTEKITPTVIKNKQYNQPVTKIYEADMQAGQKAIRKQEISKRAALEKNRHMIERLAAMAAKRRDDVTAKKQAAIILAAARIRAESISHPESKTSPSSADDELIKKDSAHPTQIIVSLIQALHKSPPDSEAHAKLDKEIQDTVAGWAHLPVLHTGTCIIEADEKPLRLLNVLDCCGQTIDPHHMLQWFLTNHTCPGCRKKQPSFHPFPQQQDRDLQHVS